MDLLLSDFSGVSGRYESIPRMDRQDKTSYAQTRG